MTNSFSFLESNYLEKQKLIRQNAPEEQIERYDLLEIQVVARMRIEMQKLISLAFATSENARQMAILLQQRQNQTQLIINIIVVALIGITIFGITGSIAKSIAELMTSAEAISDGQLDRQIQVTANDEMAVVANSFNKMTRNIIDLNMANIKLKELDRLKSMFIASMSHELRTPLNSIIGFTGIILQGLVGEINDEQRNQLQRVYNSAKHLLELINDVIDISKIEAGKIEAFAEEFSLDEIVKEAVSSLKNQIDDKGLAFEVNVSPDIHLKTDRRRLLQCILNYLSNATKFTERGKIDITANETKRIVEIKVKDTGIGIKEEEMPRLFNSFARLDSHLKTITPGTGLGLYLTKKLTIEVLGGSVSVESRYGEGSTFVLKIPKEI